MVIEMTDLTTEASQTMSSREISNLTGKLHKSVMRDIRHMLNKLEQGTDLYLAKYKAADREYDEYLLPRRECEILITGYDVKRRAAVIDRWHALETGAAKPAHLTSSVETKDAIESLLARGLISRQDAGDIALKAIGVNVECEGAVEVSHKEIPKYDEYAIRERLIEYLEGNETASLNYVETNRADILEGIDHSRAIFRKVARAIRDTGFYFN